MILYREKSQFPYTQVVLSCFAEEYFAAYFHLGSFYIWILRVSSFCWLFPYFRIVDVAPIVQLLLVMSQMGKWAKDSMKCKAF